MMRKFAIVIVLLAVLMPLSAFGVERAGELVYVRGQVQLVRNAQNLRAALKTPIIQGDTLATGPGSVVKILFVDDSVLTINAQSKFTINEYSYDTRIRRSQSIFKLLFGRLRAVVGRSSLKVLTDTAVCGVKGTVFDIWVDSATHTTHVAVIEGSVELRNISPGVRGVQIVTEGNTSSVTGGSAPTPPAPIPPQGGTGGQGGGSGQNGGSGQGDTGLPAPLPPPGGGTPPGGLTGGQPITNNPPIHQTPQGFSKVGINVVFP